MGSRKGAGTRFFVFELIAMNAYSQQQVSAAIDRLEQNQILYKAGNFIERMKAIDALEFQLLADIEHLGDPVRADAENSRLVQRAELLKQKLADANERLFTQLLLSIRANDRSLIKQYFRRAERKVSGKDRDDYLGYDEIDMLVNGLLEVTFVPEVPERLDAEMFFYQPTPARIVLKLIHELRPTPDDVFYDLGSGLGHVPILVNLLADIKTRGIELEVSFFRYSNECLKKLGLASVEFVNADARHVDYEDGTIFYMYTPFHGEMLRQVLRRLEAQSRRRKIKVCTYGPCTLQVGKQNWLRPVYQTGQREGSLAIFESL